MSNLRRASLRVALHYSQLTLDKHLRHEHRLRWHLKLCTYARRHGVETEYSPLSCGCSQCRANRPIADLRRDISTYEDLLKE